ncbi:MAG: phosphotriesterase-related protein [Limnochordales bacterium]
MKRVRTIKGDIDPSQLGITYTHEHLICFPPPIVMQEDADFELPRVDKAIEELQLFYEAGGRTLVEGTCIDYGRDVKALIEISRHTPVNIIFTTGFNKGRFHPDWVVRASMEELRDLMIREIEEGAEGTSARPGVLKAGAWYNVITAGEEKVLRAVAQAHRATGVPIWLHTERGTMALEMLDILEEEGVDLTRVAVGHLDRNPDLWLHLQVAKRGAFVGYDGPSKIKYYPDSVRVQLIKGILDAGYGHQLLISGDMGRRSYLTSYGGGPGFRYILTKFIPRLLDEGLSQADIDQIWIHNPARWLAF